MGDVREQLNRLADRLGSIVLPDQERRAIMRGVIDGLRSLAARGAVPEGGDYPHEQMDAVAAGRYKVVPTTAGFWPFAVKAGDGEQELYKGHRSTCETVAKRLTGAFLDGGFAAASLIVAAAPQPAGEVKKDRMPKALCDWLSERGLLPEVDEEGGVDIDGLIEMLNTHEDELARTPHEPAPSAPSSTSPRDSDEPAPVIVCAAVIVAAEQLATIAADYLRRAEDCSVVDAIDEGAGADDDEPSKALRQATTQMQRALAYPAPSAPADAVYQARDAADPAVWHDQTREAYELLQQTDAVTRILYRHSEAPADVEALGALEVIHDIFDNHTGRVDEWSAPKVINVATEDGFEIVDGYVITGNFFVALGQPMEVGIYLRDSDVTRIKAAVSFLARRLSGAQPAGEDEKEYEYLQSLADDPRLDGWAPEPHRVTKKSTEPAPSAPSPGDALSLHGAAGRSASREPADVEACPLGSARWSARGGFLCYGTARIAQFDWESGYASADSLRARTQDWIARRLSGAQQAAKDDDIGPCDPTATNHGFDRTASHSAGTYVCECGGNGEMAAKDGAE